MLKVVPVKKIIEKARLIIHHQKIKDLDLQKENYQDQVKREKNQGNRRKTSQAQEEKILDLQKVKIKIKNQIQNPKVKKARIKNLTKRIVEAVIKILRDNPLMEMD